MISLDVLPAMKCDDNCGECCGIVLCKQHEFQAVNDYAAENNLKPIRQGITCPWLQNGRCAVYPVRPFICRLYGHAERLRCPRGYNTNIRPDLEKKLVKKYGKPTRFLHEVFPDGFEIMTNGLKR